MEATTKNPVFYRTYARKRSKSEPRETESQAKSRVLAGLFTLGNFTEKDKNRITQYLLEDKLYCSGRYYWAGGTEFSKEQKNFYSLYNCSNFLVEDWRDLADTFLFLMQGSGTGAILEFQNIKNLPTIQTKINLEVVGNFGESPDPYEFTIVNSDSTIRNGKYLHSKFEILCGDSKEGWRDALLTILSLSSSEYGEIDLVLNIANIRAAGALIKGFGGVTNPSGLVPMFQNVIKTLNAAIGRKVTPLETSLLLNQAALCTVAGNVRRSARIDQFSQEDLEAGFAKTNLWTQDEDGNWKVDESKNCLRMANFTRVWHHKPSLEEIKESLRSQFKSGEGAIMYAPEAIARANVDILNNPDKKKTFLSLYENSKEEAKNYLKELINNG